MGGKTTSTSSPKLNGLQVQSSTLGLPISLGWGRGRMKCNLMWYGAFTAIAHTTKTGGGKGLGGGSKNTTYTYTASIMMGICEGGASGIQGIRTIYKDTAVLTSLSAAGLSLAAGAPGQAVWNYLTSKFPAQAIPYSGIAYVYAQDYDLADSATLSNHSFEIDFAIQMAGLADADPKDIITDFLTNASYGVPMWGSGLIGDLSDYSLYCRANNLLLSPVIESQSSAASILEEWLTATNSAAFWSEGVIKIRPYGDAAATGNSVTWTPNLTPAYDLTEDDLVVSDDGNPVSIEIVDQSDAYNIVQFEFLDRSQQYNVGIATAQDLDNIVTYGRRKQDPTTVHCICDAAIARQAVQLYGQRVLYTREKYTFTLPWNFALLEPTDLVTLTTTSDSLLLNRVLVRITEIGEDADGLLAITAEGVPVGVASAAQYASHSGSGYASNTDIAPGSVSTPWLFIAPPNLAGIDAEIWLAAASTSATWGGCQVWISTDGTNYPEMVGTVNGPARYGTLTSTLPAGSDPDTTNTLAVNLATSLGQLIGGSPSDMDAGATLCLVGDEVVAYQNATLTSAYHYSLAPLRRGQRGTTSGSHSSGANFARLDDAIFKFGYDPSNVGDTIYVKLPSFNIYGRGLEDLSAVTAYSIAITSAPGRPAYRDVKYQRSYSQPSTPTGDTPTGWFDNVPSGSATIWQSTALKTSLGTLIGVWSSPTSISGLTPRGDYDNAATYYVNNSVIYGGGSYVATQDNFSGHAPSGTAQANAWWDILSAPGAAGGSPGSPFTATINLTSGAAANLRTLADAAGYTGNSNATITYNVPSGVTCRGMVGGFGIDTGSWPTSSYTIALTLVVQSGGVVDGGGGNGGDGAGGGGNVGGDAIFVRVPLSGGITINTGGTVRAGGGGGGGGASTGVGGKIGGDGGGGGAPNGHAGAGAAGSAVDGNDGSPGTTSGGGAGGGNGGAGGTFATAGSNSTNSGGTGGAAGFAVRKNGNAVTVTNSGTMTGTAA